MIIPNMTSTIARIMFERDDARKKLAIAIEALEKIRLDDGSLFSIIAKKALEKVKDEK